MGEITGELVTRLPGVHMLMFGGIAPGYESAEAELAKMPGTPIADESAGSDMLYSSGTTGRPKGVKGVLTGAKLTDPNALVMLAKMLYGFDEQTTYLSPAPLYHAAPLRYNMTVQRLGGTCIVMEHFDPSEALRLIGKYTATHSQWVPTMFVRMLKLPEAERRRHDVSSMKVAIHAAAPCPIPVKKQMIEWWGPVIFEYYAGTEGNGFCAINSQDWLAHPGSVGKSLLGELHIVGEDGAECPTGEPGTIYFANGPAFEYHNDPGKTADARNQHGWSTLGDVGYVDKDGYLYLTDRKAFMIISGGVNIYPQEAENVLINHPKVADVAVIGIPNEDFGEEVKAVVQPMLWSDATPELATELIAYCREHLSQIKCPRTVDFEPELPRHPTGKLYKRLIRDRYWGNRESKIV
jgi:acyl-CoA synthetase (AMP-forming)/AMP-acid ligase II